MAYSGWIDIDYSENWQLVFDVLLFGMVPAAVDSCILLGDTVRIIKFIMMNDLSSIDMNQLHTLAM